MELMASEAEAPGSDGGADVDEILAAVKRIPEVCAVYTTAGDPDALVHVRVEDVQHLNNVIGQLRKSGLVTATKTLMVVDAWMRHESTEKAAAPPPSPVSLGSYNFDNSGDQEP